MRSWRASFHALCLAAVGACAAPAPERAPAPSETRAARPSAPAVSAPALAHGAPPSLPPARDNLVALPEPAAATAEPAPVFPFNVALPGREIMPRSRASRLASLSPSQCSAELRKRGIKTRRAGKPAPGVATPLRLDAPLHGVRFVTPGVKSVYGILDCRLALVLDELAVLLAQHGVVEVKVDNMYRPKAKLPGRRKRSQHSYGLAVDIYGFVLAGGKPLEVEGDWRGELGAPPCGPESRVTEARDESVALRNLFCEVARAGLFHHLLTPSYDLAHRDHLHLDIARDSKELLVK